MSIPVRLDCCEIAPVRLVAETAKVTDGATGSAPLLLATATSWPLGPPLLPLRFLLPGFASCVDEMVGRGDADGLREFTESLDLTDQFRARPAWVTEDTDKGVAVSAMDEGNDRDAATDIGERLTDVKVNVFAAAAMGEVARFDLGLMVGLATLISVVFLLNAAPLLSTILNS